MAFGNATPGGMQLMPQAFLKQIRPAVRALSEVAPRVINTDQLILNRSVDLGSNIFIV